MEATDYLGKLNFVLERIIQQRTYGAIQGDVEPKMEGFIGPGEFDAILDHLRKDGYLEFVAGGSLTDQRAQEGLEMRRSFKGFVFLSKGGYTQQEQDLKDDRIWLRTLQTRQTQMAKASFRVNLCIAIATGVAALYYLDQLFLSHHYSTDWWVLTIVAIGISSLTSYIVYRLLNRKRKQL